jgi:hypothetical protein
MKAYLLKTIRKIKKTKFNKKLIIILIIIFLVIIISIYPLYKLGENYFFHIFSIPEGPEIIVDKNSRFNGENGSEKYPFKSLVKATLFIKTYNLEDNLKYSKILIHDGEYGGMVSIPPKVEVIGIGEDVVIKYPQFNFTDINIEHFEKNHEPEGSVLTVEGNNKLKNLKLKDGFFGVYIIPDAAVEIDNCLIENNNKFGVYNKKFKEVKPENKIKIINSTITKSGSQGLYMQKAYFEIKDSLVTQNEEEGIDLHANMISYIDNTEVKFNGEGGIESELDNNEIYITNSLIQGNRSSGINLQSAEENAKVKLENNQIKYNFDYGLRCAVHAKTKKGYFSRAFIDNMDYILANNQIEFNGNDNGGVNMTKRCLK